jgi:hypothetical protein
VSGSIIDRSKGAQAVGQIGGDWTAGLPGINPNVPVAPPVAPVGTPRNVPIAAPVAATPIPQEAYQTDAAQWLAGGDFAQGEMYGEDRPWWDIPQHIAAGVETVMNSDQARWIEDHGGKGVADWWNNWGGESTAGKSLAIVTAPIRLPVMAFTKGMEVTGDIMTDLQTGASFLSQAQTIDNPLYRDGVQLEDFGVMWDFAQNNMSPGQAMGQQFGQWSRIGQRAGGNDMMSPENGAAADYASWAPIFDVGFNPYDMTPDERATLNANAVYGIGTGSLDLGFQVGVAVIGDKGITAGFRAAGIAKSIRGVSDLRKLDREISDHANGVRETVAGRMADEIVGTSDVNTIMHNPLVNLRSPKAHNVVQMLARADNANDVRRIILADRGDRRAIAELLNDAPDYIFEMSDVAPMLAEKLVSDVPSLANPGTVKFLETAFASRVERDSFFRNARDAFLAGDSKATDVEGLWTGTTRNNKTMPLGTTGNSVLGKPGDLLGTLSQRGAQTRAKIARGEGLLDEWVDSDNWTMRALGKIGSSGPITKTLQWTGGRKPMGVVSLSASRPNEVLEEVNAWIDDAVWTTGNVRFQVVREGQAVEMSGPQYRAEVAARISEAVTKGPSTVATVVRQIEEEMLSTIALNRKVDASKVTEVVRAIQAKRDIDLEQIQSKGYFYDAEGSQVLVDPVYQRQLADSIHLVPLRVIDREFGSHFENGLYMVDRGYEAVQRLWRTAVLFKPAYTLKNAIAEPLVASIMAHGSVFSPDGIYTTLSNVTANTRNRLMQAGTAVVDRTNATLGHVPGVRGVVQERFAVRAQRMNKLSQERVMLRAELDSWDAELDTVNTGEKSPAWKARNEKAVTEAQANAAKRLREIEDELDSMALLDDMPSHREVYTQPTYGEMRGKHAALKESLTTTPATAAGKLNREADDLEAVALARSQAVADAENARLADTRRSIQQTAENVRSVQARRITTYIAQVEEVLAKRRARLERLEAAAPPRPKADPTIPDKGGFKGGTQRVRDQWPVAGRPEDTIVGAARDEVQALEEHLNATLAQYQRLIDDPTYAGTPAQKAWLDSLADDPMVPKAEVLSTNIRQVADAEDGIIDGLGAVDSPRAYGERRVQLPDGSEVEFSIGRAEITATQVGTGDPVGYLIFQRKPNGGPGEWEPAAIEVEEAFRRNGVGTEMFRFAQDANPHIRFSHSDTLTQDGAAFAKAEGSHTVRSEPTWLPGEAEQVAALRAQAEKVGSLSPAQRDALLARLDEAEKHLDEVKDRLNKSGLDAYPSRAAAEEALDKIEEEFAGLQSKTASQMQQRLKHRERILGGTKPVVWQRREDGSLRKMQYLNRREGDRIGAQWKANEQARLQGRDADIVAIDESYVVMPGLFDQNHYGEALRADFGATVTNRSTFDPGTTYSDVISQKLVRGGGTEAIPSTDPMYFEELAYVANRQVREDPITVRLLAGGTAADLRAWIVTPEGRAYAEKMGWTADNARNQVTDAARLLEQYYPKDALIPDDLLKAIRDEGYDLPDTANLHDVLAVRDVSPAELQQVLAHRGGDLSPVHSGELVFQEARPFRRAQDAIWRTLATHPEERVGRFPGGQRYYEQHLADDIKFIQQQSPGKKLTPGEINVLRANAAARALADVEKTYYNIRRYSHPVYAMRYLTAFPGALYNSMYRMSRLSARSPGKAIFMANAFTNGFTQFGVDENGQKTEDFKKVKYIVLDLPIYMKNGVSDHVEIGIQSLDFVRPSPSFAWTVAVPTDTMLATKPDAAQWIKDNMAPEDVAMLWPFGDPTSKAEYGIDLPGGNRLALDSMVPSHFRDALTLFRKDEDRRYTQTVRQYLQAMSYQWEEGGRQGEPPTLKDAQEAATKHWEMQLAAKFGVYGGLSFQTAGDFERTEWQRIRDEYGEDYEGALAEFLQKFGPSAEIFTVSTTKRAGGVPASVEGWDRMFQNEDLVKAIMEIAPDDPSVLKPLFADAGDSFDQAVYNAETHTKIPGTDITIGDMASSQEWLAGVRASSSWDEYLAAKAVRDAEMVRYGYGSIQSAEASWLRDSWNAWKADFASKPENQAWVTEYQNRDFGRATRTIKALELITSNEALMKQQKDNPYFQAMSLYISDYRDAADYFAQASDAEERTFIVQDWQRHVQQEILPLNQQFARIYDRYLDENDLRQAM